MTRFSSEVIGLLRSSTEPALEVVVLMKSPKIGESPFFISRQVNVRKHFHLFVTKNFSSLIRINLQKTVNFYQPRENIRLRHQRLFFFRSSTLSTFGTPATR